MKRGEYFQDNETMLTDRWGVQLTDDERIVWLSAFGCAVANREDMPAAREFADRAVEHLRDARGHSPRPV